MDQISQSNIPPLQSLPQQAFGGDQVINDIEEIFNISEREHFIIAKSDTKLIIIFDQHQGDYSKLTIADQQSFKISQGKNVESSVCHKTKRYFFSDGPKVFSISPENKGNTLNFKEVYDLKSKHLQITSLKSRYSGSKRETQLYIGLSCGKVLIFSENLKQKIHEYDVYDPLTSVTQIAFVTSKSTFTCIFGSNQSKELKFFVSSL